MGFGKGELFLMLCLLYPNAKFHIVAPGKDIAEGLVRRLTRLFPNVGLIGAGKNFYGDRITVFVAKSMPKSDGDADFLLCDEAHLLAAPTHARSISFVWRHSRNFGFTGTLDMRMDNADRQLELLFGVPLFKMTYADAVSEGLVVPITVRWLPVALSNNPVANLSDPVRISRKGVWQNHERNKIIADDIRTNYSNLDTQILILCQTTDHAIYLWQHLPEFELCYGALSGDRIAKYKLQGLLPEHYTAVDGTRREQLRDGFAAGTVKRVIATDVWATGVDFVNLQVLYRIDARSSEIVDNQGPGRLSRTAANKTGAVLVDCWDSFDSRLLNKAMKRKANYKKLGWKQTNVPRASLYDATASD
jgi:superfamily II DNA or RNA helicase